MQIATIPEEWRPIPSSSQYLDASSSTALTVPTVPTGEPAKGATIVGVLTAQNVGAFIRTDGSAVTAAVTGGRRISPGDYEVVCGYTALKAIRIIREASGGSVAVEYYYFRD